MPRSQSSDPSLLTEQQKLFASEYARCRNGKQSAINAGYSVKNAISIGSRLLRHPGIVRAIEQSGSTADRAIMARRLKEIAPSMLEELIRLATDPSTQDAIRYSAAKDILDRAGYKPVEKQLVGQVTNLEAEINSFEPPEEKAPKTLEADTAVEAVFSEVGDDSSTS